MALFYKKRNYIDALSGIVVGLILRLRGGEEVFNLPSFISYPMNDPVYGIQFPFRTFAMVMSLKNIIVFCITKNITKKKD